ncbi:unnamed protein product [Arctogadus glacialis]
MCERWKETKSVSSLRPQTLVLLGSQGPDWQSRKVGSAESGKHTGVPAGCQTQHRRRWLSKTPTTQREIYRNSMEHLVSAHGLLTEPSRRDFVTVPGLARGGLTMQLDALRTVQILLALASFALGNQLIIDPLAAPRVTISFKARLSTLIRQPRLPEFPLGTPPRERPRLSSDGQMRRGSVVMWFCDTHHRRIQGERAGSVVNAHQMPPPGCDPPPGTGKQPTLNRESVLANT